MQSFFGTITASRTFQQFRQGGEESDPGDPADTEVNHYRTQTDKMTTSDGTYMD